MVTVDKKHVSTLLLVEAYAEKHKTEEKVALFHKKYNIDFDAFEKMMHANEENYTHYDDYMEWKAYNRYLDSIKLRIKDLKNGSIQLT
ncbi:MAG TPA: hypothetical protein VJ959_10645 [Desulfotignum sp.]|nr:hypothetical protein [Desulfotignum sp.]